MGMDTQKLIEKDPRTEQIPKGGVWQTCTTDGQLLNGGIDRSSIIDHPQ